MQSLVRFFYAAISIENPFVFAMAQARLGRGEAGREGLSAQRRRRLQGSLARQKHQTHEKQRPRRLQEHLAHTKHKK